MNDNKNNENKIIEDNDIEINLENILDCNKKKLIKLIKFVKEVDYSFNLYREKKQEEISQKKLNEKINNCSIINIENISIEGIKTKN